MSKLRIERNFEDVESATIGDTLRWAARDFGDRPGLIGLDGDGKEVKKYTFKEYHERALNVASALQAKKVKIDDRIVLVFLPGSVDACIAFYGCIYCGAIPVCVYPPDPRNLTRDVGKLEKVLQDCNAVYVLTNTEYSRLAFRPFTGVKWPPVPWLKVNDLKKKRSNTTSSSSSSSSSQDKEPKAPNGSFAFLQYTVCLNVILYIYIER